MSGAGAGRSGVDQTDVAWSSDGITWNKAGAHFGITNGATAVHYSSKAKMWMICAPSKGGTVVIKSSDGKNWTRTRTPHGIFGTFGPDTITYDNFTSLWLMGNPGGLHTSPDGDTWTQRDTGSVYGIVSCGGQ